MTTGIIEGHDHNHCDSSEGLTKNEHLVFHALKSSDGPLKAYDLLDTLKEQGVRAPMTVYRALEGLEHKGLVHKLDKMNAFVLCNHDSPHRVQTFIMCDKCDAVQEVDQHTEEVPRVEADIMAVVLKSGFTMSEARLEIKGLCSNCGPVHN